MVLIDDGKGTGKTVGVNDDNQLEVKATTFSELTFVSRETGETFITSVSRSGVDTLTFAAGESGRVFFLKNNSTIDLILDTIGFSSSAAGGILKIFKNDVEGTITQTVSVDATAMNFGSAKVANITALSWDETNGNGIQGLTGTDTLRSATVPASTGRIGVGGAIIIPQGKSITVAYDNITGGSIEFECVIRFYYVNSGS